MWTIKDVGKCFYALVSGREANENGPSFFDVKAAYDAAYEEKAKARTCLRTFKALLKKAEGLDSAYRARLPVGGFKYGKAV
jgi:hypothetical protein